MARVYFCPRPPPSDSDDGNTDDDGVEDDDGKSARTDGNRIGIYRDKKTGQRPKTKHRENRPGKPKGKELSIVKDKQKPMPITKRRRHAICIDNSPKIGEQVGVSPLGIKEERPPEQVGVSPLGIKEERPPEQVGVSPLGIKEERPPEQVEKLKPKIKRRRLARFIDNSANREEAGLAPLNILKERQPEQVQVVEKLPVCFPIDGLLPIVNMLDCNFLIEKYQLKIVSKQIEQEIQRSEEEMKTNKRSYQGNPKS